MVLGVELHITIPVDKKGKISNDNESVDTINDVKYILSNAVIEL